MKHTKEWLETLPKELKKDALEYDSYIREHSDCLSEAIFNGLNWRYSNDGAEFWGGLCHNLEWAESDNFEIENNK